MRQLYLNIVAGLALSVGIWIQPDFATSATVLPADDASEVIVIRNLVIKDGAVSCDLVNKSAGDSRRAVADSPCLALEERIPAKRR